MYKEEIVIWPHKKIKAEEASCKNSSKPKAIGRHKRKKFQVSLSYKWRTCLKQQK